MTDIDSTAVVVYKPPVRPQGRPSTYSTQTCDWICELIVEGFSLRAICLMPNMPSRATVHKWLEEHKEFQTKYARAREQQADLMDDRILEVANKAEAHEIDPRAASVVIGALQWRASKLKAKVYGDTQRHEHTGEGGGPILLAPAERAAIHAEIMQLQGVAPKPDGDGK